MCNSMSIWLHSLCGQRGREISLTLHCFPSLLRSDRRQASLHAETITHHNMIYSWIFLLCMICMHYIHNLSNMSANGLVIFIIHFQNEFLEECRTCCTIIAAKSTSSKFFCTKSLSSNGPLRPCILNQWLQLKTKLSYGTFDNLLLNTKLS